MDNNYIKSVAVTPKEVLAGDSVELTVKIITGSNFSANNSRIILDLPAYLGYTRPSCRDQEDNGYVAVMCSNPDIRYIKRVWDMEIVDFPTRKKTSFKGMAQRLFILDLLEGDMCEDDEILIKWGYTRNGFGVGTKVSTLVLLKEFYNAIHVRYFKDGSKGLPDLARSFKGYNRPIPDAEVPVRYRILPREPERIRLIRKEKKAYLLVQDRFANICDVKDINDFIVEKLEGSINSYGVLEMKSPDARVTTKGLPLLEARKMDNAYNGYNIYFGDLHTHSAFSNDCIEREKQEMTPAQMFEYAKMVAGIDFMAITDHHQPWDEERNKIGEANWNTTVRMTEEYNRPGEFITFPGFEFRCERGDTEIVINDSVEYDEIDKPGMTNITKLWEYLKCKNYISIPHFHNPGSLEDGEWFKCPYEGVEPNLEIYSCHGSYESGKVLERHIPEMKSFRRDRHGKYFLSKGFHYGFTCNSDGHKGNPGCNGLTAVFTKKLSRDAIFEAIRSRRVYGTTNARIKLLFTINGSLMGAILPQTDEKNIRICVNGENTIKAVDLIRNGDLHTRFKPGTKDFEKELIISDKGNSNWYVRITQVDNHIAYSSPIWFE